MDVSTYCEILLLAGMMRPWSLPLDKSFVSMDAFPLYGFDETIHSVQTGEDSVVIRAGIE